MMQKFKLLAMFTLTTLAGQLLHAVEDVQRVVSAPCTIVGGNLRTMVFAGQEYQNVRWCGFGYLDFKGRPFLLNTYDANTSTFWGRTSRGELSVIPGAFLLIVVENYAYVISWKNQIQVLDLSQGQAKSVGIFPAKFPYREPSADLDAYKQYMSGFSYEVVNNKIWLRQSSSNEPAVRIDITDPRNPVVK